jgi:hypothetical protein
MNNLLNAAKLGLEYAEQVLAERKLDLAGCPHKWADEDRDVAAIRAAIEAAEKAKPVAWRYKPMVGSPWSITDDGYYISCKQRDHGYLVEPLYAAPTPVQPVAWRDHVEQRLLTWRKSTMNPDGDRLSLEDFMDKEGLDDLIDFVCDEFVAPAPVQQPPLTDEQITEIWESQPRWHAPPIGATDREFARDIERAVRGEKT